MRTTHRRQLYRLLSPLRSTQTSRRRPWLLSWWVFMQGKSLLLCTSVFASPSRCSNFSSFVVDTLPGAFLYFACTVPSAMSLFIGLSFIRALTKWKCQSIYHLDAVYNLWLTGYVWGCSSDALWWNCKAAAFHLGWGHGREKEVQRRPVSLVGKTVCRPGEILENTTQHDATTHQ